MDIAVDPIDGTSLTATGMSGALSVVALATRGSMYSPGKLVYMNKIAVGPEAVGAIDINAPVGVNLKAIAAAKHRDVDDLTVMILDRPRHAPLIRDVREAGARIRMIRDGDVAAAIAACTEGTGIDVLMGVGGSPEAVITACALKCLGGEIQCKLWPRDDEERAFARRKRPRTSTRSSGSMTWCGATRSSLPPRASPEGRCWTESSTMAGARARPASSCARSPAPSGTSSRAIAGTN